MGVSLGIEKSSRDLDQSHSVFSRLQFVRILEEKRRSSQETWQPLSKRATIRRRLKERKPQRPLKALVEGPEVKRP